VGKQEIQPAIVGFVVSVSIVILASVGGEEVARDEVTVSAEDAEWNQERALPEWLVDYNLHVPLIGVFYYPPDRKPHLVGLSESQRLMDSLSPGVRTSYEGAIREREDAEHAAFVEERRPAAP
jgi:hypothetical protein